MCTEVVTVGGSTNVTDMFPSLPFTLEMRNQYCHSRYGIIPRNDWLAITVSGSTFCILKCIA